MFYIHVFLHCVILLLIHKSEAQYGTRPPAIVVHPPLEATASPFYNVRFMCVAYGIPTPTISWERAAGGLAERLVDKESEFKVYTENVTESNHVFTVSILEISYINYTHSDEYICTAENGITGAGLADPFAKVFLTISGPPSEPATLVVQPPKDSAVYNGSTVQMTCVAHGSPLPTIQWSKKNCQNCPDISLSGATTRLTNEEIVFGDVYFTKSVLEICNVTKADTGYYSCEAWNGVEDTEGLAEPAWEFQLVVNRSTSPSPSVTAASTTAASTSTTTSTSTAIAIPTRSVSVSRTTATGSITYPVVIALEGVAIVVMVIVTVILSYAAYKITHRSSSSIPYQTNFKMLGARSTNAAKESSLHEVPITAPIDAQPNGTSAPSPTDIDTMQKDDDENSLNYI